MQRVSVKSLTIIGYARVSTKEQAESLAPQVTRLKQAGCVQVFTDMESGRNSDRDGLLEVMALVKAGKVTELLIDRVDRLGRDSTYTDALIAQCEAKGVVIRALVGGEIETTTPQGFLLSKIQTAMAEMESRMLSLRIRRQFDVYRAEGRHLRRRKPFGYRGGPDHKLVPDPDQWDQALRVLEELKQLGSFTGVANQMATWCMWKPAAGNLQAWFCNPVIRGHMPYKLDRKTGKGWNQRWSEIHYDQHPALISESDWRDLADLLQRPRNTFGGGQGTETKHGLTGLLRCINCGHRMRRNSSAGVVWWRCRHRLCQDRAGVKEELVMPVVVWACIQEAQRLAAVATAPPDTNPAVAAMLDELEAMERLAARNPDNRAMALAVQEQRQQVEAIRRVEPISLDLDTIKALRDPHFFEAAPAAEQRSIFQALLRGVLVGAHGDPISPLPRSS